MVATAGGACTRVKRHEQDDRRQAGTVAWQRRDVAAAGSRHGDAATGCGSVARPRRGGAAAETR